mmetsp:Transcript_8547/g.7571  ORF Transcript_8547/g.7571 Transcript_8547/m.7571 type:complete len:159 (+) Transcript_8547:598-1074(+)
MDNLFQYGQSEQKEFYSIQNYKNDFTMRGDDVVFSMQILQDSTSDSYERKVYSIMDLSGQLGGFFEIIAIIGGLLVNKFSNRMYYYTVFNKLYHKRDDIKTDSKKKQEANLIFPKHKKMTNLKTSHQGSLKKLVATQKKHKDNIEEPKEKNGSNTDSF